MSVSNADVPALIAQLEREMRAATGFVRIHAAEALIRHGRGNVAADVEYDRDATSPFYRIGVWRVLARTAGSRERFVALIRQVAHDSSAPDHINAVESLAKLNVVDRADRSILQAFLQDADDAAAAFPCWLLLLSSEDCERAADAANLAALLESQNEIARLRAFYALGQFESLPLPVMAALRHRARVEPADSAAQVYALSATFRHDMGSDNERLRLKSKLLDYLNHGRVTEKFEAAAAIAQSGTVDDADELRPLLADSNPDARIAAADAMLLLLHRGTS